MSAISQSATRSAWLAIMLFAASSLVTPAALAAGSGGGGGLSPSPAPARNLSPEDRSDKLLRAGIRQRDKALKQEAKAANAKSDRARDKALARAQKAYNKAIEKQTEAIQAHPQNYKAANELGFALRKTGEYRKAIGAYNYSLKINPEFHQATEYRAEALLALGYYDQTRTDYLKLFRNDRTLADQLMSAFIAWLEEKNGEFSEEESKFADWVESRRRLANITSDLSRNNARIWPQS